MPFRSYQGVRQHLDALGMFHMELGLERMRRVLTALGLERPPFAVVQVLGTNGKGSTSAFLASLCAAHGCRTGLYTSPHFVSPEERIRVDGRPVPGKLWPAPASAVLEASKGEHLTYFEFLTVLALLLFREAGVDVAIMEAGLGGRNDATTAIAADVLCFTPIAMDHAAVLGPTLAHIAGDKAAAVRSAAPVCMAEQFPLAAEALRAAANATDAPLTGASPLPKDWLPRLGLAGAHQLGNAALALTAWGRVAPLLGCRLDDAEAQALGLARAFLPGRLQILPGTAEHPALLLDGAHNPHGMQALLRALGGEAGAPGLMATPPAAIIFSCLGDKDWRSSAGMLRRRFPHVPFFIPALENPRAAEPAEVAAFLAALSGAPTIALDGPDALGRALVAAGGAAPASDAVTLMTGSLYLLAEFFGRYPGYLEPPSSSRESQP
ncbi:MAG: bifunctional folylpolyglutamate synthase/ dihydrofolate synthase [Desulfovibrio sp.]|nr:bifunctional folylpolyglutamate synthase/ dihydrofolate synthase [Desulfovibrio sp.]